MNAVPLISVVIPIYKSAESLASLVEEIDTKLKAFCPNYEIILIDDASPDNSWAVMSILASESPRVKCIQLSRNFGQHPAIMAGLQSSTGEWVIVMDADFQDDPSYLPELYKTAVASTSDLVFARRKERTDSVIKKLVNRFFYSLFSSLTDTVFDSSIGNFGIYSRRVINAVLSMKEPFKVFSLMVRWVGFKASTLDVVHGKRKHGKSAYTFPKLVKLAVTIIVTYSEKPMMLMVKLGIALSVLSFGFAGYNILAYFFNESHVIGYASLISSIWFLGGLIIFLLGIMGLYVGKILEGVKNRPSYIIASSINLS